MCTEHPRLSPVTAASLSTNGFTKDGKTGDEVLHTKPQGRMDSVTSERPHSARYPPCTTKLIPAARGGGLTPPAAERSCWGGVPSRPPQQQSALDPALPPPRRRPPLSALGSCLSGTRTLEAVVFAAPSSPIHLARKRCAVLGSVAVSSNTRCQSVAPPSVVSSSSDCWPVAYDLARISPTTSMRRWEQYLVQPAVLPAVPRRMMGCESRIFPP